MRSKTMSFGHDITITLMNSLQLWFSAQDFIELTAIRLPLLGLQACQHLITDGEGPLLGGLLAVTGCWTTWCHFLQQCPSTK